MTKIITIIGVMLMAAVNQASTLDDAVEFIAKHEGFRAEVYKCQAGKKTIGYGFTDPKYIAKGKMTKTEAKKILRERVAKDLKFVEREFPKFNSKQLVAITSLVFNIGQDRFLKSQCYTKLKTEHYVQAMAELVEFRLANGKVSNGLVCRRADERKMFGF